MPYIDIDKGKLHYLRLGTGPRVLLAFHGYGEQAASLAIFATELGSAYTLLSFDLPHHGLSEWPDNEHLTELHLAQLATSICSEYGVNTVSLMGYSIGGRVCLAMLKAAPLSIDKVLLMATDGLRVNKYYYFVTHTMAGRFLFNRFLRNPATSLRLTTLFHKTGVISLSYQRLTAQVLQSAARRQQLQQAWPCLSKLVYSPAKLRAVINHNHTPVLIFMGRHDRVLPPFLAERFITGVNTARLFILEKGHRIFDVDNVPYIAQHLLS
jgi:pimeloyl-ACP methyl ester carboxylesterase